MMDIVTAVRGLSTLAWLAAGVLLAVAVARASRKQPTRPLVTGVLVAVVLALLLTTAAAGLVFVPPDQRGVVISALAPKGYREQALTPGLHWIIPYAEYVVYYPISKQTYTMSATHSEGQIQGDDSIEARTLDGQVVFIDASVIFAIDPKRVVDVHIAWQDRYAKDLVRPLARGVIRDAVSQFRVDEVISTRRFELEQMITQALSEKLQQNGLVLDDFVMRNISFTAEYAQAIEQKQIAEQRALQAKFEVEQKKQEAEQARQVAQGEADAQVIRAKGAAEARLIEAKAEAEALRILSEALGNDPQAVLTYFYITKITPGIQSMILSGDFPFLFNLPAPNNLPTPTPTPTPAP